MKKLSFFFTIMLLSCISIDVMAQPIPAALTTQSLKPHETINKAEFARQYQLNKNYWDEAFLFLKDHDLDTMAVGKYVIDDDNVYATITENPTKDLDSTKWESHRNYIDLHSVIKGEEKIGVASIENLTVTMPYTASKDLINYSGEGKFYVADPGTFFLFFRLMRTGLILQQTETSPIRRL